jgi:hypothetical protein
LKPKKIIETYSPYITGLFDGASSVMERYWLSSSGVAIIVDPSVSLFVKKNLTDICFLANNTQWPYNPSFSNDLKYDICQIEKTTSQTSYLNQLHLYVINKYFSKPIGTPDELMLARPIWSSWAYYKKLINEKKLKAFANEIIANNFTYSNFEIDDKWQTVITKKFSGFRPKFSCIRYF